MKTTILFLSSSSLNDIVDEQFYSLALTVSRLVEISIHKQKTHFYYFSRL